MDALAAMDKELKIYAPRSDQIRRIKASVHGIKVESRKLGPFGLTLDGTVKQRTSAELLNCATKRAASSLSGTLKEYVKAERCSLARTLRTRTSIGPSFKS